jgi:hypothetical protein
MPSCFPGKPITRTNHSNSTQCMIDVLHSLLTPCQLNRLHEIMRPTVLCMCLGCSCSRTSTGRGKLKLAARSSHIIFMIYRAEQQSGLCKPFPANKCSCSRSFCVIAPSCGLKSCPSSLENANRAGKWSAGGMLWKANTAALAVVLAWSK